MMRCLLSWLLLCACAVPACAQMDADGGAPVAVAARDFSRLDSLVGVYNRMLADYRRRYTAKGKSSVRSLWKGERKVLDLNNLVDVLFQENIRCKVYVLAQALLETGWFSSRVCREYHNLFGLYDSRVGDYYRFACWEDSVVAYQRYVQYRYREGSYLKFLRDIGYAEDPDYCRKVAVIARDLAEQMAAKKGF